MTTLETIPTTWDDARDGAFCRIMLQFLDSAAALAGSSLLEANDPELINQF